GCLHSQLTGNCDDGNACTVGDTCVNGACLGAPTATALSCSDGDACNGLETCDPGTGNCVAGTPLNCDDGDVCTTDTCDPLTGCANTALTGLDGALCELDVIIDQLKGSTGTIKGRRLPNKLSSLTLRARVKVELATRAANAQAVSLLNGSDKKLRKLLIVTNN